MSAVQDFITSANESVLDLVTSIHDQIIEANRTVASTVVSLLPETPSWLPSVETFDAKAVLEQGFQFQSELLQKNRDLTLAVVDAYAGAAKDGSKTAAA